MFTYMRREYIEGFIESSRHSSPLQWLIENTGNKGKRDGYNRKTKEKASPFPPVDKPPPSRRNPRKTDSISLAIRVMPEKVWEDEYTSQTL